MVSFFLALTVVFFASLGGRGQVLVARLSSAFGQSGELLGVGLVTSAVTAAGMAFGGVGIAAMLPASAQNFLVIAALAVAAIELLWPVKLRVQLEPTRSYGAIALVMIVRQFSDAARIALFALAAATLSAQSVWLGGALGGAVAIYLGWSMGDGIERHLRLRAIRLFMGGVVMLMAAWIGLQACA